MAKNIYVGNLAWGVTDDILLDLFSQYGQVKSAQVISDRETGRSRGFGFVEMENDEEAQKAIEALNGANHENRQLTVNVAREREERAAAEPAATAAAADDAAAVAPTAAVAGRTGADAIDPRYLIG